MLSPVECECRALSRSSPAVRFRASRETRQTCRCRSWNCQLPRRSRARPRPCRGPRDRSRRATRSCAKVAEKDSARRVHGDRSGIGDLMVSRRGDRAAVDDERSLNADSVVVVSQIEGARVDGSRRCRCSVLVQTVERRSTSLATPFLTRPPRPLIVPVKARGLILPGSSTCRFRAGFWPRAFGSPTSRPIVAFRSFKSSVAVPCIWMMRAGNAPVAPSRTAASSHPQHRPVVRGVEQLERVPRPVTKMVAVPVSGPSSSSRSSGVLERDQLLRSDPISRSAAAGPLHVQPVARRGS